MIKSILSGKKERENSGELLIYLSLKNILVKIVMFWILDVGGYLLKNINTFGKKVGVEINPIAREMAEQNGIYCVDDIKKIEENSIDVVITNHALEHVDNPIEIIQEFKRVVRNNGIIVIVVPHEISSELKPYDINMHLYTWSPQNLYNLLTICGIDTLRCERLSHAWIPNHLEVQKQVGWKEFHRLCKIYAEENNLYQTIAVGTVIRNEDKRDDQIVRSRDSILIKYYEHLNNEWKKLKENIEKSNKLAIYGAGTVGKQIYKFLREKGYETECFVVSEVKEGGEIIDGVYVVPFEQLNNKSEYLYIIGIKNQMIKESIIKQLKESDCNKIVDFNTDIVKYMTNIYV